jgi:2-polyprenyl-3-methyl-5-hydroxy-6-metoxy-1,4-benzoquinol methylase
MKRVVIPELLDTDAGSPQEIEACLQDLQSFNRHCGGITTGVALLRRIAQKSGRSRLSVLDVAAASGDVPQAARAQLAQQGLEVEFTLLDRSRRHLKNGSSAVVGDALQLPFTNNSYDVVSCGLFAHHLEPEQVVGFASEGLRVGRLAVLINDLVRHPLHFLLACAAVPLYRSRLTRHDAPVSIRRAYTPTEMMSMLRQTAASQIEISRHFLFRMGVIAWK